MASSKTRILNARAHTEPGSGNRLFWIGMAVLTALIGLAILYGALFG